MKKIGSVISLSFLIILLLVGCEKISSNRIQDGRDEKSSSDWVKVETDMNGDVISYKIEQRIENTVQLWGERIFSDEGRKEFIRTMRDYGFSTKGLAKSGHIMSLYEINCHMKTGRLLSIVIYDTGGKIIYADSFVDPQWEYIPPDSVGDKYQKKVCE